MFDQKIYKRGVRVMKNKEWEIYQRLCVGCERERYCHKHCEVCEEYEEALEELEKENDD